MSHKMLRPLIFKVFVLGYFPYSTTKLLYIIGYTIR